ncbi:DeoR/GlpR family DNA-binding transcription regulator [Nesterenkonia flava]
MGREGTVSVQQLADHLGVTRETVRRDLDQLETEGSLRRIHGGAVPSSASSRAESSLQERLSRHAQEKLRIAEAALAFLPPAAGGSMIIDAGTTTEALADLMAPGTVAGPDSHRFLITNALPIAQKLSSSPGIEVEILGGSIRGITGAAVGAQTATALQRRRADVVFLGTNGVDSTFGLSTPDTAEAAVKTALLEAGRQRVVLADSSKLGRTSLVQFARLEDIDVLITDAAPQGSLAQALTEAEVRVVVAS